MADHHLKELGLYSTALYNDDGGPAGYAANGDGAVWSGMYAGSQALRWLVTKDPKALANYKRVVKGLMLLMDITDSSEEVVRTAHLFKEGETLNHPWARGQGRFAHIKYIKGGNNDMIK